MDIDHIVDYLFCPIYYKLRKNNISTNHIEYLTKYERDIKKFTSSYNFKLASNTVSTGIVKQIFGKLWIKEKDFVIADTSGCRNIYSDLRKKGISDTLFFHEAVKKNPYTPLLINLDYSIPFGDMHLRGRIPLLREKDNKVELVDYLGTSKHYLSSSIKDNINTVAAYFALEYLSEEKIDGVYIYVFDRRKYVEITNIDTDKFYNNIINVTKAINSNIIYQGTYDRCFRCEYKKICPKIKKGDSLWKKVYKEL